MKGFGTAILTLMLGIPGANTWACGDSYFRAGNGPSHRVYTAPLTGSVLVYGKSESAVKLAKALAESGHSVEIADSEVDLSLKLQSGKYDVVIAAYSDHTAVQSSASSVPGTTYLPVALNKAEEKIAEQSYSKVMLADRDGIKDYLKAIHKTLKAKAS